MDSTFAEPPGNAELTRKWPARSGEAQPASAMAIDRKPDLLMHDFTAQVYPASDGWQSPATPKLDAAGAGGQRYRA
jgi:hypothetical protein